MNRRARSTCARSARCCGWPKRATVDNETENIDREAAARRLCLDRIRERDLTMKLVSVDYMLDGRKAVFYFIAENRIDFRDLVRDLANTLRVRVEMKQIGARDETKVTGGLGPCGRELCCSSWLRDFEAVTVKMAREQGLALNPSRLAGMCGRLKCCLRYEYATYVELQARPAQRRQARAIGQGRRQGAAPEHPQADRADPARRRRRSGRGDAAGSGGRAPAGLSRPVPDQ